MDDENESKHCYVLADYSQRKEKKGGKYRRQFVGLHLPGQMLQIEAFVPANRVKMLSEIKEGIVM